MIYGLQISSKSKINNLQAREKTSIWFFAANACRKLNKKYPMEMFEMTRKSAV